MELKPGHSARRSPYLFKPFNRTFMELKPLKEIAVLFSNSSFNRTFMELKPGVLMMLMETMYLF